MLSLMRKVIPENEDNLSKPSKGKINTVIPYNGREVIELSQGNFDAMTVLFSKFIPKNDDEKPLQIRMLSCVESGDRRVEVKTLVEALEQISISKVAEARALIQVIAKHLGQNHEEFLTNLLQNCAKEGSADFARFLVEQGANANGDSKAGLKRPLNIAARAGNLNVIKYLVSLANVDPDLMSFALHHAVCEKENDKVIFFLLDQGASMAFQGEPMFGSAFHRAIARGNQVLVQKMVEKDASLIDLIAKPENLTPLFLAAFYDYLDIMQYLLDLGATCGGVILVSRRDDIMGNNILHCVIDNHTKDKDENPDREIIIRRIIKCNRELVNQPNKSGSTPFHSTAEKWPEVAEFILDEHADIDLFLKNGNRQLAVQLAMVNGHYHLAYKILGRMIQAQNSLENHLAQSNQAPKIPSSEVSLLTDLVESAIGREAYHIAHHLLGIFIVQKSLEPQSDPTDKV